MLNKRIFYPLAITAALSLSIMSCGGNSSKTTEEMPAETDTLAPNTVVTVVSDSINGHALADLGLSIRWATDNVGGDSTYYGWGETETKEEYTKSNSAWGYKSLKAFGVVEDNNLVAKYDVATQQWGAPWRMPTKKEIHELVNKCRWDVVTLNDSIKGFRVTGPNGNSIFLAANGYMSNKKIKDHNIAGRYWSATNGPATSSLCITFNVEDTIVADIDEQRIFGQSVRAVAR